MKMTRCFIVDANSEDRSHLSKQLSRIDLVKEVVEFDHPLKALKALHFSNADIIFTETDFENLRGMEIVKMLENHAPLVLISHKPNYCLEAFEHNVYDYLLKPVNEKRLIHSYNNFIIKTTRYSPPPQNPASGQPANETFYLKGDHKICKIEIDLILYIEGFNEYVKVHTKNKTYTSRMTMKDMEAALQKFDFKRIHRSYIVPLNKIDTITTGSVEVGSVILPISKTYKKTLMESLNIS